MISQEELEYAISRFKARQAGVDFDPQGAAAHGAGAAAYVGGQEYQVDESLTEDAETYATVDDEGEIPEGVPQYVESMSDSSLIELEGDVGDPDDRR